MHWPHRIRRHKLLQGMAALLVLALCAGLYSLLVPQPALVPRPADAGRPAPAGGSPDAVELTPAALKVVWEGLDPVRPAPRPRAATPKPSQAPRPKPAPVDLELRGIIYSDAGDSVAFIERGKQVRALRVGLLLDDWRVQRINPASVVLMRKGRRLVLTLKTAYGQYAVPVESYRPEKPVAAAPPKSRANPSRMTKGGKFRPVVRRVAAAPRRRPPPLNGADARVVVPRKLIEKYRSDPARVIVEQNIGVAPHFRDGKMAGLVLQRVPLGSLPAVYGFAVGDRIVAVNGKPLNSTAAILDIYSRYRNSDSMRVTLERNGTKKELLFYSR